ncbi:hypothetical protein B0J13DRAFT_515304 [Dactylonectria estremocensis]|uniref:F-box domain-containing protein n=1 Tax=Dactylonectria estremocensis TaxID=1079267 RepID=A0A9P9D7S5_9HYPO|nr:hypothetical protein B0J13DRAFT_515304 [Dactylonectria estremocensis]
MAPGTTIGALPSELVHGIFSHVNEQKTIQQSRCVSRKFNDVASQYLITTTHIRISSESISRLEEFCNHPFLNKSVTKINIILSCYDTNMANNRPLYMQDCDTQVFQRIEILERMNSFRYDSDDESEDRVESQLQEVIDNREFAKISEEGFEESIATPFQKLAMRLHAMYNQRCSDQEEVRQDNSHIRRICFALSKLSNIRELNFTDALGSAREELRESDFPDLGLDRTILKHFDFAISPSGWCGSFTTAYSIVPPVEMLGELCSQLGHQGVQPRSITMNLNTPSNLRLIGLSSEQQLGLRILVAKATKLKLVVDGWARKNSLAENNDRPRDEMLALCSFTQHFFSAPNLESLHIWFAEYPCFYETPTVSLMDILPLQKSWPQLSDLELRYQPTTLSELKTLVALQGDTVKNFNCECVWLLDGGWHEAIEAIRGFGGIEKICVKYPRGERYGSGRGRNVGMPYDEVCRYILKQTDVNPLE